MGWYFSTLEIDLLIFQTYQGIRSRSFGWEFSRTGYFWEHSGCQIMQEALG